MYTLVYIDRFSDITSLEQVKVESIEIAADFLVSEGAYVHQALLFENPSISNPHSDDDPLTEAFHRKIEEQRRREDYQKYLRLKQIYEGTTAA